MKNINRVNALQKHKASDRFKWIVVFVLITLLSLSTIAISIRIFRNIDNQSEQNKYSGAEYEIYDAIYEIDYRLVSAVNGKPSVFCSPSADVVHKQNLQEESNILFVFESLPDDIELTLTSFDHEGHEYSEDSSSYIGNSVKWIFDSEKNTLSVNVFKYGTNAMGDIFFPNFSVKNNQGIILFEFVTSGASYGIYMIESVI